MSRVLVIPDLQAPFHHPSTFDFLLAIEEEWETDTTVCIGDELDFHALSRYTKDPNGYGAKEEFALGKAVIQEMATYWPTMHVCQSNHTDRPWDRAFEAGLPDEFMRSYNDVLEVPKTWKVKRKWVIDDVAYEHGNRKGVGGAQNAARNIAIWNSQSTVIGHHPSGAGVRWLKNDYRTLFGLNVGCLVDDQAYAFKYGRLYKEGQILGAGAVIDGHPYFIHMREKKPGVWDGKLRY